MPKIFIYLLCLTITSSVLLPSFCQGYIRVIEDTKSDVKINDDDSIEVMLFENEVYYVTVSGEIKFGPYKFSLKGNDKIENISYDLLKSDLIPDEYLKLIDSSYYYISLDSTNIWSEELVSIYSPQELLDQVYSTTRFEYSEQTRFIRLSSSTAEFETLVYEDGIFLKPYPSWPNYGEVTSSSGSLSVKEGPIMQVNEPGSETNGGFSKGLKDNVLSVTGDMFYLVFVILCVALMVYYRYHWVHQKKVRAKLELRLHEENSPEEEIRAGAVTELSSIKKLLIQKNHELKEFRLKSEKDSVKLAESFPAKISELKAAVIEKERKIESLTQSKILISNDLANANSNFTKLKEDNEELEERIARSSLDIEKLREDFAKNKELSDTLRTEKLELERLVKPILKELGIPTTGISNLKIQELVKDKLDELDEAIAQDKNRRNFSKQMLARIRKSETQYVVDEVIQYAEEKKDQELLNSLLKISSRFGSLRLKQKSGEISENEAAQRLTKINNSIIDILLELRKG